VSTAGASLATDDRPVDQANVRRAALGGLVGTALEDDAVPGRRPVAA
jgi:hypothetical protein